MVKLLHLKKIATKRHLKFKDVELLYKACSQLPPVDPESGVGDCVETDVYPEDIRKYGDGRETFVIRQVANKKWRVWKK